MTDGRLTEIYFNNWKGSASEIHPQTLSLIASKTSALNYLYIESMAGATNEGKHTMASFAAEIIRNSPPLTFLSLNYSNLETCDIEAIRVALIETNIRSLTWISLQGNPDYLNTDSKCVAWATVLRN